MPIVHFKGKVLAYAPQAFTISITNLPSLDLGDTQLGQKLKIDTRIEASIVDVEMEVETFNDQIGEILLIRALDLARAAVDTYCFSSGWGLGVIIDTLVKPDGSTGTLVTKMETLAPYSTAVHSTDPKINNFDACYRLLVSEPPLFMAMNDLIVSITLPHHASVNCARVVEALRVLMVPAGTDRKQAWPIFQSNLNIDRTYREYVTGVSTGPRHGDRTWIPGTTMNEVVKRTWIIMNRFLEYRKRGNHPLPLADFPLLAG